MASRPRPDQLIVIVGPTASGKSDVAMRIARRHKGEIICADSRTVYKGLNIGTAKPTPNERREIPHHLLDIVEPDERFNAAEFKQLANIAIKDIKARGRLPLLVGGAGLFIDAVLFDYEFGEASNLILRTSLEERNIEELLEYCVNNNIEIPANYKNKRHLIRAIEQRGVNYKRKEYIRKDAYVVGISPSRKILQQRIHDRSEEMFKNNVVSETTKISKEYGWSAPGLSGNIYSIIHLLLNEEITIEEAINLNARADWQLARRQMTWFRRNNQIKWCESPQEAEQLIEAHLAKQS